MINLISPPPNRKPENILSGFPYKFTTLSTIDHGLSTIDCRTQLSSCHIRKQTHAFYTLTPITEIMTPEIILRYLHFVSIFTIAGVLISEHFLLKKTLTRAEIARLARIDAFYGLAAMTLLAVGLTLWLGGFGKPSVYYTMNWVFHTKLTLFLTIGLLSIYPTVFFIRHRKGNPGEVVSVPGAIFWMLRLELLLLALIPLFAGLMARGIGFFG